MASHHSARLLRDRYVDQFRVRPGNTSSRIQAAICKRRLLTAEQFFDFQSILGCDSVLKELRCEETIKILDHEVMLAKSNPHEQSLKSLVLRPGEHVE
jgi:hypothetical protein